MNAPPSPINPRNLDVSLSGDKALVRILGWMLALTLFAFVVLGVYAASQISRRYPPDCSIFPPAVCQVCGGGGCPWCVGGGVQPGDPTTPLEKMTAYARNLELAQHALDEGRIEAAHQHLPTLPPPHAGWEFHYLSRRAERLIYDLHLMPALGPDHRTDDATLEVSVAGPGRWVVVETSENRCSRVEMVRFGEDAANEPFPSGLFTAWKTSRDGSRLVCASGKRFTVWDRKSGRTLLDTQAHEGGIHAIAFSRDGSRIYTVGDDPQGDHFRVWQIEPADRVVKAERVRPLGLTFEAEGKTLTMLGEDGIVRRWRTATGERKPDVALAGFDTKPGRAILHGQGGLVAAVGKDGAVRLWDARTGKLMSQFAEEGPPRHGELAFSPSGQLLAGVRGGAVRLWNIPDAKEHVLPVPNEEKIVAITFSSDGWCLACRFADGNVASADILDGKFAWGEEEAKRRIRILANNAHSAYLMPISEHVVRVRQEGSETNPRSHFRTTEPMLDAILDHGGKRLVAACAGGRLVVWDTVIGVEVASFLTPLKEPCRLAFTPDNLCLAVAGSDGTIHLLRGTARLNLNNPR